MQRVGKKQHGGRAKGGRARSSPKGTTQATTKEQIRELVARRSVTGTTREELQSLLETSGVVKNTAGKALNEVLAEEESGIVQSIRLEPDASAIGLEERAMVLIKTDRKQRKGGWVTQETVVAEVLRAAEASLFDPDRAWPPMAVVSECRIVSGAKEFDLVAEFAVHPRHKHAFRRFVREELLGLKGIASTQTIEVDFVASSLRHRRRAREEEREGGGQLSFPFEEDA